MLRPQREASALNPSSPDGIRITWVTSGSTVPSGIVDRVLLRTRLQIYESGVWTSLYSWSHCPDCVDWCDDCSGYTCDWTKSCSEVGLVARGWYFLRSRVKAMVFEDGQSRKAYDNSSGQWVKCNGAVGVGGEGPSPSQESPLL